MATSSWNRLKLGAGILLATVLLGVTGYVIAGWRLLDAVYMVVITVFGVGYGEVRAIESDELRVFTIALIIAGCSALIYILGGVFQLITEGELNRALGKRRMTKEIEKLRDHVIVCGFGRIGHVLVDALDKGGVPYVIVDRNSDRLMEAATAGARVFEGDATEEATLEAVGIGRATTLATVLPSDALNVFITLTARNLNRGLTIIARGEHPSAEPKLLQAGADRVVLPTAIGADQIAQLILHPDLGDLFDQNTQAHLGRTLGGLGTRLHAGRVPVDHPRPPTIGELEKAAGGGFVVIGVRAAGGDILRAPGHSHPLQPGDELLLLTRSDRIPDLESALRAARGPRELTYRGARVRA